MKTLSYVVVLLLSFAVPVRAAQVYSGCAVPPTTPRHVWYIDSVHGKTPAAGGNGSQAAPWNSLIGVLNGSWATPGFSVPGYARPLLSSIPYYHRDTTGKVVDAPDSLGSPPVQPGDTIMLMSGNYGDIYIGIYNLEITNSNFVTVQAAPGQAPVLSTLYLNSTNNWVFNGLKVQSLVKSGNSNPLIFVQDQGPSLPTANIVFENMTVSSQDDAEAWSKAQWVANARSGFFVYGRAGGANTKCISLTGSHISNVRFGAYLSGNQLILSNNQIDHFGDDGIDYAGSNIAITHNDVHDNLDVGDGNHADGVQGTIGFLPTGAAVNYFQNVLIDSNLVIRQTDPELSFPAELQGINAFDSDWTNVTVTNNVVITSTCWGMSFSSIHNSLIANNTVVEDGLVAVPGCTATLAVGDKSHQGPSSSNTVVRNNLSNHLSVYNLDPGVVADHNVTLCCVGPEITSYVSGVLQRFVKPGTYTDSNMIDSGGTTSEFVNFNPSTLTYNVMLKSGAQAIGAGTATGAPTVDILGVKRTAPCAVGAYSYPY